MKVVRKNFVENLMKIAVFIVVFGIIFYGFQRIYHERWDKEYKQIVRFEKTNLDYDVVFVGTSELFTGAAPMPMYDETGMYCYNLAHTRKSAMAFYYDVEYILKTDKPKVIATDFSGLFMSVDPEGTEIVLMDRLYAIRDRKIHNELLKNIFIMAPKDAMYFAFPLLRFHDFWSIENANFEAEYAYDEIEPKARLGWDTQNDLHDDDFDEENHLFTEESFNAVDEESMTVNINPDAAFWYEKMMALCKDNGVEVVGVQTPGIVNKAVRDTLTSYLDENNIKFFDYSNYQAITDMGLDWYEDYYDETHLNYCGAIVWSRFLAKDLMESLQLTDHRNFDNDDTRLMDSWLNDFNEKYEE